VVTLSCPTVGTMTRLTNVIRYVGAIGPKHITCMFAGVLVTLRGAASIV
jgi:hypothetical protein